MSFTIPLFKLNFDEREEEAVLETIRSKWISTGPRCADFEDRFSELLNVDYSVSLANCTGALHLALAALDISEGDEVLCPSLSFAATVNSVRYVNATPVFCDVSSASDPTISLEEIKAKVTDKTKAIIVMHFGGYACAMDEILTFAKESNIYVIEDACHAPLSEYKGEKLGTLGDIGCFSFFSNKNISTGEGGMLVTNNEDTAKKIRLLRSHGMTTMSYERSKGHATRYDIVELGYNYRMDDIRASIGIVQLQKLPGDLIKRTEVRKNYLSHLSSLTEITIPFADRTDFSSNYIFPIVLNDSTEEKRDQLRDYMHAQGIQTSVHYPSIHQFSIYQDDSHQLPITEYISGNSITLPIYGSLTEKEVEFICATLKSGLNEFY